MNEPHSMHEHWAAEDARGGTFALEMPPPPIVIGEDGNPTPQSVKHRDAFLRDHPHGGFKPTQQVIREFRARKSKRTGGRSA